MPSIQLSQKNVKILAGLSALLFGLTILVLIYDAELARPWKKYQRKFYTMDRELTLKEIEQVRNQPDSEEKKARLAMLEKRLEKIEAAPIAIRQLWLTDLGITDRCMTCHLGVEMDRFREAEQPLTAHPGSHLAVDRHPVERYGCVVCHAGQGVALETHEAHGEGHNWVEPFLPGTRAESSCVACHPMATGVAETAVLRDAPTFSRGRTGYLVNNCLGCHVLDGFQRPKSIGPILTALATKTDPSWTRKWIKNPKAYLARTVMPDFELPDEEIRAMTAYLFSLNDPLPADAKARSMLNSGNLAEKGLAKLNDLGCLGCHAIDGKDEGFGPDLSRVGEKVTPEWLYNWIDDPKKYWPETAMPRLRVPEEDIQLLVGYLSSLKGEQAGSPEEVPGKDLVERGRMLIRDKGCTGCHKIGEFSLGYNAPEHNGIGRKRVDELVFGNTDIPHTLPDWLRLKVKNPRAFNTEEIPTLMPKFGFSDEQAEEILTFLLSLHDNEIPDQYKKVLHDPTSPQVAGERLVEQNNCRGCHRIGGRGGSIGPDLGFEGERVNPEWLVAFLKKPFKIRPSGIEPTRMPTFGFSDDQAQTLAAYFAGQSGAEFPYYLPEKVEMTKADTEDAWKLYWQSFSCQACHGWNGQGGIIGPDQTDLRHRLRKEWVAKWLQNPQKYIPDVQMPNFELYPDEAEKLTNLMMSFTDVPLAVWERIRKQWEDEQLLRQAQQEER